MSLALTDSEEAARPSLFGSWSQLKARLLNAEHLLVQRLAGTVFLIRVFSAALAFGSQVLFARWMGTFEFGIYVYVWTWVLLLGQAIDLGLGTAAQRFIPEYRDRGMLALLRGFVSGSRWLAVSIAICIAGLGAGGVRLIEPWLDDYMVLPLYLACITMPAYALANVQEGISRSYDWVGLAMMPAYIARQLLLTVLMAAAYFAHLPMNAVTAMTVADVDGVSIAGLLFDAGSVNSQLLMQVGPDGSSLDHSANPTTLSDVFFRIGGAGVGKATQSLVINSANVIADHMWLWRADHGSGVGWTSRACFVK